MNRFRYWFDGLMGKGAPALILTLAIVTTLLVALTTFVLGVASIAPDGAAPLTYGDGFWVSLTRTLDPGIVSEDSGWGFRALMLFCTLVGIFIMSTLIGVINNGISDKLESLRRGRSFVLESNHTLILGWSNKIYTILSELIIANESQSKPRIVILADRDKVEMEEDIRTRIPDTRNTKIICRSGSSIDPDDLHIVNPYASKSIIVLSPQHEQADIHVIKTVLAITNSPNRRSEPYHIVSEIFDAENLDIGKIVGKDEASFILTKDYIARMIVQTCRQSGLSVVYSELLDFDGNEIYFHREQRLVGLTFAQALLAFDAHCLIGIVGSDGTTAVNPPMDRIIGADEQLIMISEDDSAIALAPHSAHAIQYNLLRDRTRTIPTAEQTIVLGWNEMGMSIVHELDQYVAAGSGITIVANSDSSLTADTISELEGRLAHQSVEWKQGDSTNRAVLDSLGLESYDHIIVLSYSDVKTEQEADAMTLITLLHLRDISDKVHKTFNIVSQILDVKNRDIASVTKADDFIVSDKINSLMLAQLSENAALQPVFDDLFSADGSEVYLKPIEDYVETGVPVNFYTLTHACTLRGEVAIGFKRQRFAQDPGQSYGVIVNPRKTDPVVFETGDRLIVLAQD